MTTNRRLVRWLIFPLFFLALSYSVVATIYLCLPRFLEKHLFPRIFDELGIPSPSYEIRGAGITGMDLSSIQLGDPANPDLFIESLRFYYSPADLLRKRVSKISIGGLTLNLEYRNNKIRFHGLNPDSFKTRVRRGEKPPPGKSPPLPFEKIEIRNFLLRVKNGERIHGVPGNMEIVVEKKTVDCFIRLFPGGHSAEAELSVNLQNNICEASILTDPVPLNFLSDLLDLSPDLDTGGAFTLSGAAALSLSPFSLNSAKTEIHFHRGRFDYRDTSFSVSNDTGESVLKLSLDSSDKPWRLSFPTVAVTSPHPVNLSGCRLAFDRKGGLGDISGKLKLSSPLGRGRSAFLSSDSSPLETGISWQAREKKDGTWVLNVSRDGKPSDLHLKIGETTLKTGFPDFNISTLASTNGVETEFRMGFPRVAVSAPEGNFGLKRANIKGRITLDGKGTLSEASMDMNTAGMKGRFNNVSFSLPRLLHRARFTGGASPMYKGTSHIIGAGAELVDKKVEIRDLNLVLPIAWPPMTASDKGKLNVSSIRWKNRDLGYMEGEMRQVNKGAVFDLEFNGRMIPGMNIILSGNGGLAPGNKPFLDLDIDLDHYNLPDELILDKIHPALVGLHARGVVKADAEISLRENRMKSRLDMSLEKGRLTIPDKEIEMSGIHFALSIPDLMDFHTEPAQMLTIDKLVTGGIEMHDAKVKFQIESPQSILWESATVKWCGGNISTQSFRSSMPAASHEITLYCDRLNVSEILNQLGAFNAKGKGTVNGKIPVEIKGGKIMFKDGFLYSTPGDGGLVRITGTEVLTAGIPMDTPQFAQLELAREALKDYRYNWVKLILNTRGEELYLTMKMDGKPEKPLPFVYRKDLGGFARVDADSPGSNFQGINIDVNFMIPLNSILKYGTSVRDLINMNQ